MKKKTSLTDLSVLLWCFQHYLDSCLIHILGLSSLFTSL